MPFVEEYSVKFWNGNLHPHVNVNQWPDMVPDVTDNSFAALIPDAHGLHLEMSRGPTEVDPARNSLRLNLEGKEIPLDSRFLMRVRFDLPFAQGVPLGAVGEHDDTIVLEDDAPTSATHGVRPSEVAAPSRWGDPQPAGPLSVPELWAIALSVSPTTFDTDNAVNLTCQFNNIFRGVRLNTPGALQKDKGACLESPLDYGNYQGGYIALPNGTDGVVRPPIFTLELSFCGWNAAANGHTVQYGALQIARSWMPNVVDHRVFSSDAITSFDPPVTSIESVGVSLVTNNGVGRYHVRMLSFSLWRNYSL